MEENFRYIGCVGYVKDITPWFSSQAVYEYGIYNPSGQLLPGYTKSVFKGENFRLGRRRVLEDYLQKHFMANVRIINLGIVEDLYFLEKDLGDEIKEIRKIKFSVDVTYQIFTFGAGGAGIYESNKIKYLYKNVEYNELNQAKINRSHDLVFEAKMHEENASAKLAEANNFKNQSKINKLNEAIEVYKKAIVLYEKAIALNPGMAAEYRRNKEAIQQQITQLGNQIQAETHATTAATQLAEANNLTGQAKIDKLQEAKMSFIQAKNLNTDMHAIYLSEAQALQEAIETLRREQDFCQAKIQNAVNLVKGALDTNDIDRKVELYSSVVKIFPNAKLSEAVKMLSESKALRGVDQFNKIKGAFVKIKSAINEDSQYKDWAQDLFVMAKNRLEQTKKILKGIQQTLGHKKGEIEEVVEKINLLDNGARYPFIKAALDIVDLKNQMQNVKNARDNEQKTEYLKLLKLELKYAGDFGIEKKKKDEIASKIADLERNLSYVLTSQKIRDSEDDIQQLETTTIPELLQKAYNDHIGRGNIDKNRFDYISEIFEGYYVEGMENILDLRIKSIGHYTTNKNIVLAKSQILDLNGNNDISGIVYNAMESKLTITPLLILPELRNNYHWVGLILDLRVNSEVRVTYLDSENQVMPTKLRDDLINKLKELNKDCQVLYQELKTEQQKYNNCGSELIENIVLYLTGERISQEGAFYLHSALFEAELTGKVFNSKERIKQIGNVFERNGLSSSESYSNSYFSGLFAQYSSNTLDALAIVNDNTLSAIEKLIYSLKYAQKKDLSSSDYILPFFSFISSLFSDFEVDLSLEIKKLVYYPDVVTFKELLKKYSIDSSVNILSDMRDFKKKVLLKLHPDKGGDHQDFIFAKSLQDKFVADLDVSKIIDDRINAIQPMIYKTINVFQILDSVIDVMRFGYAPTLEHAKKLAYDASYIYSMYKGVNGYSSLISCVGIIYKYYNHEYGSALQQLTTTMSFMALPAVMEYTNIPYFSLVYSTAMMTYTGYNAITNFYSFITSGKDSELKSNMAYRDLATFFSHSPLQSVYDFDSSFKRYALEVNKLKASMEKETTKAELTKKGEYGEKLYEYIYKPLIEEKYELEDKVLQGLITQEDTKTSIYAEQISITSKDFIYEHCILVKDFSNSDHDIVSQENDQSINNHYYCRNDLLQQLDHVILGLDNSMEVIKHL